MEFFQSSAFVKKGDNKKDKMKGQISFAEYLVATIVFLSFTAYFAFQLLYFFPTYLTQLREEEIRSEGYQISEILINDPGYPINWQNVVQSNPSAVQRVGLNDETQNLTNVISTSKLDTFYTQCQGNGYSNIKKWFGTSHDFSIIISLINVTSGDVVSILPCQSPTPFVRTINVSIERFADINSTFYAGIIVQVV